MAKLVPNGFIPQERALSCMSVSRKLEGISAWKLPTDPSQRTPVVFRGSFVSDDPAMASKMTITITLKEEIGPGASLRDLSVCT